MILTSTNLLNELSNYHGPNHKIGRLASEGKLVKIRRGLYQDDDTVSPCAAAYQLYGPSYISFEYAMSYHGLIPERVTTITCATFRKNRKKTFHTPIGTFTYQDVPPDVFRYDVKRMELGKNAACFMASPEKALCDKLYSLPRTSRQPDLDSLLLDDLRIDEDMLAKVSISKIEFLSKHYRSVNVRAFLAFLRRWKNG